MVQLDYFTRIGGTSTEDYWQQRSATDYCAKVGKRLEDYLMHGINVDVGRSREEIFVNFARLVPDNTEVMVECETIDYMVKGIPRLAFKGYALIPRERLPEKDKLSLVRR